MGVGTSMVEVPMERERQGGWEKMTSAMPPMVTLIDERKTNTQVSRK